MWWTVCAPRYDVDVPLDVEEEADGRLKGEGEEAHQQRLDAMGDMLSSEWGPRHRQGWASRRAPVCLVQLSL